jgi:hypothetical protein
MSMQAEGHPWERKPDEGDDAYAAFLAYRNLGAFRSLDLARRRLFWRPGDLEPLRRWCDRWDWDYRTSAWDDHQQYERDRVEAAFRELWEGRRREALENGWELCKALRGRLARMMAVPPEPEPEAPAVAPPEASAEALPEVPAPPGGAAEAAGRGASRGHDQAVTRLAKLIVELEWALLKVALPPLDLIDPFTATDEEIQEFLTRHPKIGRPPKR